MTIEGVEIDDGGVLQSSGELADVSSFFLGEKMRDWAERRGQVRDILLSRPARIAT